MFAISEIFTVEISRNRLHGSLVGHWDPVWLGKDRFGQALHLVLTIKGLHGCSCSKNCHGICSRCLNVCSCKKDDYEVLRVV